MKTIIVIIVCLLLSACATESSYKNSSVGRSDSPSPTPSSSSKKNYCAEGDCVNGKGGYAFADGAIYAGQFSNGKFHGYGGFQSASGAVYIGNWQSGKLIGACKYSPKDVNVFQKGTCTHSENVLNFHPEPSVNPPKERLRKARETIEAIRSM